MTDIPGTGKLASEMPEQKETSQVISAVNVREIKRIKKQGPVKVQKDLFWYDKLSSWLLFGLAGSAVVSLFAFFNFRFLLLAPLPPTVAACTWYVRKIVKKYEEKNNLI